jgi:hypothetical protein
VPVNAGVNVKLPVEVNMCTTPLALLALFAVEYMIVSPPVPMEPALIPVTGLHPVAS